MENCIFCKIINNEIESRKVYEDDTLVHIHNVAKKIKDLIYDKLNADGVRLVNNYGLYQAVKHYHLHIIPAYKVRPKKENIDIIFNKLK